MGGKLKILAPNPAITQFVGEWRRSLLQVLLETGVAGAAIATVDSKICGQTFAQIKEKNYCVTLNGGGHIKGTMKLILSEPEALQLSLVMTPYTAGSVPQLDETQRAAVGELIKRTAAILTSTHSAQGVAKLEITSAATDNSEPDLICEGLSISAENFKPVTIILGLSTDFAESLRNLGKENPAVTTTRKTSGASTMSAGQTAGPGSNLDLLFDVKLEATIRFGGRQLLLRDILSMSAGSVIELDRQVNEPAELLVAGRLVARGEVVVVDGKFGLRVTELSGAAAQVEPIPA
jgi:flagellar motor switch protein FliN